MPPDMTMDGSPQMRATRLVPLAVGWYFGGHLKRVFRTYKEYATAFRESFAMLFLLKTLLSPWKSIKDSYPQKGFNFQAFAETFFLNFTTRGIGAFIRLSAIIAGLAIQIGLLAGFIAYVLWWIVFPLVLIALPLYMIVAFFL